jgi:hypothetical protein
VKVLLSIGDATFECADAVSAAKVADLLGTMRPVWDGDFWTEAHTFEKVLVDSGPKYRHQVSISQFPAQIRRFATREEFEAFKAEADAAVKAKEGGEL